MNYEYTGQPLWYQKPIKALLPYIADLLEKLEIKYWLDWGTLLGAVRNGKMIPWDFDIDVGIFHRDTVRLLSTEKYIAKNGYRFAVDRNKKHARKIRFFGKEGFDFHVDIDPWIVRKGKVITTYGDVRYRTIEELEVLDTIKFEGNTYPCPKNPKVGLARMLGEDWRTPKVGSGNVIYINKFDSNNEDIKKEIAKHPGC